MRRKKGLKGINFAKGAGIHLCLLGTLVLCLYPFYLMVISSLKTGEELRLDMSGFPKAPTLDNYTHMLFGESAPLLYRSFFSTIGIAAIYTTLVLLAASLAAFAFAKYQFAGKRALFLFFLFAMMVPQEVNLTPQYLIFAKLKLLNTYQVQIIPGIANVFVMYMFRNYMSGVPDAMIEAARVDGASHWAVYRKVMLPAIAPAVGAMAVLTFLGKWNDFMFPRTMLNRVQYMPLTVVLSQLPVNSYAFSVFISLPLIVVFLIFQNKFINSVTVGAIKE